MRYLKKLSDQVQGNQEEQSEEEFTPMDLIKMDSRFEQVVDQVVKTVRHYDHHFPDIGADEILAALVELAIDGLKLVDNKVKIS